MSTGWTWSYIEQELDVPRLTALSAYWRESPPVHVLVAAYVGYKPVAAAPVAAASKTNDPAEIEKLFAMING